MPGVGVAADRTVLMSLAPLLHDRFGEDGLDKLHWLGPAALRCAALRTRLLARLPPPCRRREIDVAADEETSVCSEPACAVRFGFVNRRHHCRM